jgi:hypothetical protein
VHDGREVRAALSLKGRLPHEHTNFGAKTVSVRELIFGANAHDGATMLRTWRAVAARAVRCDPLEQP